MIEAVNSVIASASLLKGTAEQVSQTRPVSPVSSGGKGGEPPQAPYISPYVQVDPQYNTAVLQIRDSDTGDVLRQFPSEADLQSRQLNQPSSAPVLQESTETATQNAANTILGGSQAIEVQVSSSSSGGGGDSSTATPSTAQAQIASAALSAGAQTGRPSGTNVSVTA